MPGDTRQFHIYGPEATYDDIQLLEAVCQQFYEPFGKCEIRIDQSTSYRMRQNVLINR